MRTNEHSIKYKPEYDTQAHKLCLVGFTDEQLADFFEVTKKTIYRWKSKYPSFKEAIDSGKHVADAEVAAALYHRAKGYTHKEEKLVGSEIVEVEKHYPPDTAACFIWLKNRQKDKWRDKQEIENSGNLTIQVVKFADTDSE